MLRLRRNNRLPLRRGRRRERNHSLLQRSPSQVNLAKSNRKVNIPICILWLCSDPSFFSYFLLANSSFPSLSSNFQVIPSFSHATNVAPNIKGLRISELCNICSEYQNVANCASIFAQNKKPLRICAGLVLRFPSTLLFLSFF